jgi:lipid A 3-O-deacylase
VASKPPSLPPMFKLPSLGIRQVCAALVLLFMCRCPLHAAADAAPRYDPVEHYEFDFESGIIWRAGHNGTPLNYIVQPQMFTLKTPWVIKRKLGGGDLVLRSRFSLLLEPITKGPEHHFFGAHASGILEWWDVRRTRALFFSSGGGAGFLDSKGYEVKGAQGQDLNLTWFMYLGARLRLEEKLTASLGVYYQHISNGGMNRVNPGIDAVGPMLSLGWHF